jgi:hypothetical protein
MSSDPNVRVRVAALATAKANELNWPWDPNALTIKRPPLGLASTWRVSSYYEAENVTATLLVNEKTGNVLPHGVVYRKRGGANRDWAFFARRLAFGAVAAVLAYLIATRLADLGALMAAPIALVAGLLAAVVSIRVEKLPGT